MSRKGLLALICFVACLPTAFAISVIPPTFEELVSGAGAIVRARVVSTESFRTVSQDGTRIVKTRVTWQVITRLKGDPVSTLSLDFLGGRVEDEEMRVGGMPRFEAGEVDFLFVEPNTRVFCPLFAAGHGRYRVVKQSGTGRVYVARDNGIPLLHAAQVAAPLEEMAAPMAARASAALTPEAFESAIRGVLEGDTLEDAK